MRSYRVVKTGFMEYAVEEIFVTRSSLFTMIYTRGVYMFKSSAIAVCKLLENPKSPPVRKVVYPVQD